MRVCCRYRKQATDGAENASGDDNKQCDNKQSKIQSQKTETTSGGDPVYFNSISRSLSACQLTIG